MKYNSKELQEKDLVWINIKANQGLKIVKKYCKTNLEQPTPRDLDRVFQIWFYDHSLLRTSKKDIVNCLGCLFGEYLRIKYSMQWKIVTDEWGTDLALHLSKEKTLYVFPLDLISKRIDSKEDESGFFSGLVSSLYKGIEEL